jgi:hypothetical protein
MVSLSLCICILTKECFRLYPVDKTRTDDVTSETITEDDVDSKKTK